MDAADDEQGVEVGALPPPPGGGAAPHALTLTGLGPDDVAGAGAVTLDTHIDEAAAAVRAASEDAGEPVVLVGHSYGGSVVTVDRAPDRTRWALSCSAAG